MQYFQTTTPENNTRVQELVSSPIMVIIKLTTPIKIMNNTTKETHIVPITIGIGHLIKGVVALITKMDGGKPEVMVLNMKILMNTIQDIGNMLRRAIENS